MGILLKPVKWIFKILLIILVLILIIVALLYKSVKVPEISNESQSLNEMITDSLDDLIDSTKTDKVIQVGLSANSLNKYLDDTIRSQSTFATPEYILVQSNLMVQGAWVDFTKEAININVGIHLDLKLFKFKSRLLLTIKPEYKDDLVTLTVTKIKIGNMGVKWLSKLMPGAINKQVENFFGDAAKFDAKKLKIELNVSELLNKTNNDTIAMFYQLIKDNDLLSIGYDDVKEAYGVAINLNKIHNNLPGLSYNTKELNDQQSFDNLIKTKALNSIIATPGKVMFSERNLNNILNYFLTKSLDSKDYLQKNFIYEDYEIIIEVPYLKQKGSKFELVVPLKIGKGTNYFESKLFMETSFKKVNSDLTLTLSNLTLGDLVITDELEEMLLSMISSTGNVFVINNFFDKIEFLEEIIIDNVLIDEGHLVLEYQANNTAYDIYEDIKNSPLISNEIKDKIEEIKDNLDQESLESLVTELNDLVEAASPEERDALYDILIKIIDN